MENLGGKHACVTKPTCIYSQHIWIIDTVNCQQVTKDLEET